MKIIMRRVQRWNLLTISARLYLYLILSLVAIAGLSAGAIYFSRNTEKAAQGLYEDGFVGVVSSAKLDLLLEKHGRAVESLPSQMDRAELRTKELELDRIELQLRDLLSASHIGDAETDDPEKHISEYLPALFNAADNVLFFAREFAQDKAAESAHDYGVIAERIKRLTQGYRDQRLREAQRSINRVTEAVSSLIIWVVVGATCATLLVGPLGVATMHRVLVRLRRITIAMTRLSGNDTSIIVPSENDRDEVGAMARAVSVFKENAIRLIKRENELQELNSRIDIALNNMTHGLCMFDGHGDLILCNQTYAQMYALTPELTRPGTSWASIAEYRNRSGSGSAFSGSDAESRSQADTLTTSHDLADGRVISISQRPMAGGGWVAVHEDVTVRRLAEAEVIHLAKHDVLTRLPNRFAFREQLVASLARKEGEAGCALLCIDLDHFKNVNDTLGHPVGDELLKQVGARLAAVTRSGDMVARLGGDEFAIVQAQVSDATQCEQLAVRAIKAVSEPYVIEGRRITMGASIGVALAPRDGTDPDQLLKNADLALYVAKGYGRGVHRFYDPAMSVELRNRVDMERDLRDGLTFKQFEVYYQPIICLTTGRVKSFEALVRWHSPKRGLVSPSDFIPLAEETGLIHALGEWVLREATAEAATWPDDIGLAVNLSAAQLKGAGLLDLTRDALARSGFPARRLDLEVTESALLEDEANAFSVLSDLRAMGIRISLDDFGTGYSSLSYLRSFPFDKIKIDRSFVRDILDRKDCRAIVRAVVTLAGSLGLVTTAEGIETQAQLEAVSAEMCGEGQGYLFAKPMPANQITSFLADTRIRTAA
jgi:diguanylate cyclase (GGDEF)-like protein